MEQTLEPHIGMADSGLPQLTGLDMVSLTDKVYITYNSPINFTNAVKL